MPQSFLALLVLIAAASGGRVKQRQAAVSPEVSVEQVSEESPRTRQRSLGTLLEKTLAAEATKEGQIVLPAALRIHESAMPLYKIDELLEEKATKSGEALLQQSEVAPTKIGHRSILATVLLLSSGAAGFNVGVSSGHGALNRHNALAQPRHVMNMGGPMGGPARVPLPSGSQDVQAEGQVFNWGNFAGELQGSEALSEMNHLIDGAYNEEASFSEDVPALSSVNTNVQQMTKTQIMDEIEVMRLADLSDLGPDLATAVQDSLAADNSDSMPPQIRAAGEAAVDMLATKVLSVFEGGGTESMLEANNGALLDLVKLLGLDPIMSELGLADAANIKDYVAETIAQVKKNPILVEFARQFSLLPDEMRNQAFPSGPNAESEIRQGVVYSYLLNTVAKTLMYEPMKQPGDKDLLYEQMVSIFEDMSDARKSEWEPFLNLFEKMKFASVVKPFLLNKTDTLSGGPVNEQTGWAQGDTVGEKLPAGAGLSINILEAMFRDAELGNNANAQAGFELMVEPNGQDDRADGEWLREDGKRTGVRTMKMPLPKAWSNLYSSWNAAFVSNYKDNPMFYAKLINPVTLGMYHSDEGTGSENLYLWTRVVQLYVHLQYVKMTRADLQSSEPNSEAWQSDTLTSLWGIVNQDAAEAYHQRVEAVVDPTTEKERRHHKDFRSAAGVLWKGVKWGATRGK